jgi:hypothetical protein
MAFPDPQTARPPSSRKAGAVGHYDRKRIAETVAPGVRSNHDRRHARCGAQIAARGVPISAPASSNRSSPNAKIIECACGKFQFILLARRTVAAMY